MFFVCGTDLLAPMCPIINARSSCQLNLLLSWVLTPSLVQPKKRTYYIILACRCFRVLACNNKWILNINSLENEHRTIPQTRRALCSPKLLMKKNLIRVYGCHSRWQLNNQSPLQQQPSL